MGCAWQLDVKVCSLVGDVRLVCVCVLVRQRCARGSGTLLLIPWCWLPAGQRRGFWTASLLVNVGCVRVAGPISAHLFFQTIKPFVDAGSRQTILPPCRPYVSSQLSIPTSVGSDDALRAAFARTQRDSKPYSSGGLDCRRCVVTCTSENVRVECADLSQCESSGQLMGGG